MRQSVRARIFGNLAKRSAVRSFRLVWESGSRPQIEAFLVGFLTGAAADPDGNAWEGRLLAELVQIDLECRWREAAKTGLAKSENLPPSRRCSRESPTTSANCAIGS